MITSYEWDLDDNGGYEASGINVILTPDYSASIETDVTTIRLRVTDDAGESHEATTTLTTHYFPESTVDDNGAAQDKKSGGSISFGLFEIFA